MWGEEERYIYPIYIFIHLYAPGTHDEMHCATLTANAFKSDMPSTNAYTNGMPCAWVCAILFDEFTLVIEGVDPREKKKKKGGGAASLTPRHESLYLPGVTKAERAKQGVGEGN